MVSKERRSNRRIIFTRSVNHMQSTTFFLYTLLLCSSLLHCCARDDIITAYSPLREDQGQTLVSAAKIFELGVFTPSGNSSNRRYVGIWYYSSNPKIIVWVANRDRPLSDYGGVFAIADDGNLALLDKNGKTYWSTGLKTSLSAHRSVAKLEDSGNLVLYDDQQATSLWESFKNPTDTFLPGMKIDEFLTLTSWNSEDDPASGNFTFKQDQGGGNQYIIMNRSIPYWKGSESSKFSSSDELMPNAILVFLSNFSKSSQSTNSGTLQNISLPSPSDNYKQTQRLVMSFTGEIQYWNLHKKVWSLIWWKPGDRCSVYNACGDFGICNGKNSLECKCLPGFNPSDPVYPHKKGPSYLEKWHYGDYSGGCTRNPKICGSGKDNFVRVKTMKVGNPDSMFKAKNELDCKKECLTNCQCRAYYYESQNGPQRGTTALSTTCSIWLMDLNNLQEDGDLDLFVRLGQSESTGRNCENCGPYIIPYPLSTEPSCGERNYSSFQCNNSIGHLSFSTPSGAYDVTSINPKAQTSVIKVKHADSCNDRNRNSIGKILQLDQLLPFNVTSWCNVDLDTGEVEISWEPPREPTCASSVNCKDWPNSTCKFSTNGGGRCLCKTNFRWDPSVLNCTQESGFSKPIREPTRRKKAFFPVLVVTVTSVVVLSCIIVIICMW